MALAALRSLLLVSQSSISAVGNPHAPLPSRSARSLPPKRLTAAFATVGVTAGAVMSAVVPVAVATWLMGDCVLVLRSVLMPPRWRALALNVKL